MGFESRFNNVFNNNPPTAPSDYDKSIRSYSFIAPQGVGQIDTFAFDYQVSSKVTLENEITDHWLEDNTSVQDHIAVKPNIVTLQGYVAELVLNVSTVSAILGTVQNALSQAPAYLGKYSPGATQALESAISQAQNVETQISQALSRAATIANLIPGLGPSLTRQQSAFTQLSAYRDARVFFSVYTPFQVYENMAILSVEATQPQNSKDYSDIVVKMKKLNFVNTVGINSSGIAQNSASIAAIRSQVGNAVPGFKAVQ
jgi:hypothetical protein